MHFRNIGWQFIYPDTMMKIYKSNTYTKSITVYMTRNAMDFYAYHCICQAGIRAYHMLRVGGREFHAVGIMERSGLDWTILSTGVTDNISIKAWVSLYVQIMQDNKAFVFLLCINKCCKNICLSTTDVHNEKLTSFWLCLYLLLDTYRYLMLFCDRWSYITPI